MELTLRSKYPAIIRCTNPNVCDIHQAKQNHKTVERREREEATGTEDSGRETENIKRTRENKKCTEQRTAEICP